MTAEPNRSNPGQPAKSSPPSGPPLRWPLLMIFVPRANKFWAVNPADLSHAEGTEEEMTLVFDKLRVVVTGEHLSMLLYGLRTLEDLVIAEGRSGLSPLGGNVHWKINSVTVIPSK